MVEFSRYGREASTVFDLLGRGEVELCAALGWTLSKSPSLLAGLLRLLGSDDDPADVTLALEVADKEGRSDIELTLPDAKYVIEAKQGWLVPHESQFQQYAGRFDGFERAHFISLSDSSERWARQQLPSRVNGVPVRHISWDDIRTLTADARRRSRGAERLWLEQLEDYMGTATSRRPVDEQWTFCVVLSDTKLGESTFKEYVQRERVYFHPYGGYNSWPKRPPNFLCFRWGGVVQQVNRVQSFELVNELTDRWPSITKEESDGAHIVYELGPDIPIPSISTKGTYATGRVWCLLDQLLTQPTLKDAVWSSDAISKGL